MRLCDFLRHFAGEFTLRLYNGNGVFMEDTLENLNEECNKSFNIFSGFNCELWEMKVEKWSVCNNFINVALKK